MGLVLGLMSEPWMQSESLIGRLEGCRLGNHLLLLGKLDGDSRELVSYAHILRRDQGQVTGDYLGS